MGGALLSPPKLPVVCGKSSHIRNWLPPSGAGADFGQLTLRTLTRGRRRVAMFCHTPLLTSCLCKKLASVVATQSREPLGLLVIWDGAPRSPLRSKLAPTQPAQAALYALRKASDRSRTLATSCLRRRSVDFRPLGSAAFSAAGCTAVPFTSKIQKALPRPILTCCKKLASFSPVCAGPGSLVETGT